MKMSKRNTQDSESEVVDMNIVNKLKSEISELKKQISELIKINESLKKNSVIEVADNENFATPDNNVDMQFDTQGEDNGWQTVIKNKNKKFKAASGPINKINNQKEVKRSNNNTQQTNKLNENQPRKPFKPPPINIMGQLPRDTVTAIKNGLKTDKFQIKKIQ
ncbi:unnamed protein product [Euphydryas editha]|uniref:Uncharacterized protein n=1 Tax=Euphydryas editha TaxID=104508 RepID=A0AAU9TK71_EUPED|nr:unnamed protein product [Euphydryas editha]